MIEFVDGPGPFINFELTFFKLPFEEDNPVLVAAHLFLLSVEIFDAVDEHLGLSHLSLPFSLLEFNAKFRYFPLVIIFLFNYPSLLLFEFPLFFLNLKSMIVFLLICDTFLPFHQIFVLFNLFSDLFNLQLFDHSAPLNGIEQFGVVFFLFFNEGVLEVFDQLSFLG